MPVEFSTPPAPRHIGVVNFIGLYTLVKREVGRFVNVYLQTIVAPVVTTVLYYAIFALAFGGEGRQVGGVAYMEFLAPGLIMMGMAQNAFANTSSSLVIAKIQGNIVDLLMPPLSEFEIFTGFLIGALIRGLTVGLCTALTIALFVPLHLHDLPMILIYATLGTMMMASLGLAAGIWSDKFDHIAAVTNFLVTPLTFLSGTFYDMRDLPPLWQELARYNPFYYMIDGFRGGFLAAYDHPHGVALLTLVTVNIALAALVLGMLRSGYKIKS
ncbi:MAG: ABC transporter permease [Alphaproteobacteria bacterium]|nr:ABC transporter permease [Alphaproteobacteria bacterium]